MVDININVKGSVLEYIGKRDIGKEADQKKLEKMMSKQLSERAQTMVQFMKKNKVDSIGIGQYVRSHMRYKEWTAQKWEDAFPKVKVNCKITIKIKNYGKLK
jgi:spore germination protein